MKKMMNWFNFIIIVIIMSMFIIAPVFSSGSFDQIRAKETVSLIMADWGEDFSENLGMLKKNLKSIEKRKDFKTEDGYVTCLALMKFYENALIQIGTYDSNFLDRDDIYKVNHNKMTAMAINIRAMEGAEDTKKNRKQVIKMFYEMEKIISPLRKRLNPSDR